MKKNTSISLPSELNKQLNKIAKENEIPRVLVIRKAIKNFLKNDDYICLQVNMPKKLYAAVESECRIVGCSVSEFVCQRLEFLLPENIKRLKEYMDKKAASRKKKAA